MKITKKKLRKIIREELKEGFRSSVNTEIRHAVYNYVSMNFVSDPRDPNDAEDIGFVIWESIAEGIKDWKNEGELTKEDASDILEAIVRLGKQGVRL